MQPLELRRRPQHALVCDGHVAVGLGWGRRLEALLVQAPLLFNHLIHHVGVAPQIGNRGLERRNVGRRSEHGNAQGRRENAGGNDACRALTGRTPPRRTMVRFLSSSRPRASGLRCCCSDFSRSSLWLKTHALSMRRATAALDKRCKGGGGVRADEDEQKKEARHEGGRKRRTWRACL